MDREMKHKIFEPKSEDDSPYARVGMDTDLI